MIQSVSDDTFRFIESNDENIESINVINKHKESLQNYVIQIIVNSKKPLFSAEEPLFSSGDYYADLEYYDNLNYKMGLGGKRTRKYRNKNKKKSRRNHKRRKSIKR